MLRDSVRNRVLNSSLWMVLAIVLVFSSCTKPPVAAVYKTLPLEGWHKDSLYSFSIDVTDTVNQLNFFLDVRHDATYPYANFYAFMKTTLPNGKEVRDTLECIFAKPNGEWLGSGLGDVLDNKVLFRYKKRFPMGGKYQFELGHGMRDTILPAVQNIGLIIEKSE
jgi:gliding motility-associated lipoprotein GldH